jgi:hypothetical protein
MSTATRECQSVGGSGGCRGWVAAAVRPTLIIVLVMWLFGAGSGFAYIEGDMRGKFERDCYIGLEGYSSSDLTPYGKKGRKLAIQCTDCDPSCDLDGDATPNGSCTFSFAVRLNDTGDPQCTPIPLTKVIVKAKTKGTKLLSKKGDFGTIYRDGSPATSSFVSFPVLVKKFGKSNPKAGKGKVSMKALKPADKDKFTFICNPRPAGESCPGTTCGNGTCDAGETYATCPEDCPCGNGTCDAGETYATCPEDCPCGNGTCDAGETYATCPEDCLCGNGICDPAENHDSCPIDCPAPTPIACGQTMAGNLMNPGQVDVYAFQGSIGDAVTVAAASGDGFLCVDATIIDPSTTPVAFSTSCDATTPSVTLNATGMYLIMISASDPSDTGTYNVSLQSTTGACATPLGCGQTPLGTLGQPAEVDAYSFAASEGDVVAIGAATASGFSACAVTRLFDPTGLPVAESACNDFIQTPPLHTGTYTALVSDTNLLNSGNYNIDLQFLVGDRCATDVQCGQPAVGATSTPADMDSYTFTANAGDNIALNAHIVSGTGCFVAVLYGPSGAYLGNSLCITLYYSGLPQTGTYTVLVVNSDFQSSGTYQLDLTCGPP